jgi:hypothetical protein
MTKGLAAAFSGILIGFAVLALWFGDSADIAIMFACAGAAMAAVSTQARRGDQACAAPRRDGR